MQETQTQPDEQNTQPTPVENAQLAEMLGGLQGQVMFMRQQLGYVTEVLGAQSSATTQTYQSIQAELKKFQTGAPQRAMAGVFNKFIRDLLSVMNSFDDLCGVDPAALPDDGARSWHQSMQVLRQKYESVLADWGCTPLEIRVMEDHFDPDVHESVPAPPDVALPDGLAEDVIVGVARRGWRFHDTILQYPQVMVR